MAAVTGDAHSAEQPLLTLYILRIGMDDNTCFGRLVWRCFPWSEAQNTG